MGDEMGVNVEKVGDGTCIHFDDIENITLKVSDINGTVDEFAVEVTDDVGKLLMGKLAAYYHPDFKAAHIVNMAQALRTLTNIVAEMHTSGTHSCRESYPESCKACKALEESDAASALQDYDNAWKVDV